MSAPTQPPEYKGAPLDGERGPGLGCFWVQIVLLTMFLILTPLTVTWGWDPFISGALLIFTLILLLFSGQTIIFLLRLVAADRRTRRTPLDPAARRTVGQMEDEASSAARPAAGDEIEAAGDEIEATGDAAGDEIEATGDDRIAPAEDASPTEDAPAAGDGGDDSTDKARPSDG